MVANRNFRMGTSPKKTPISRKKPPHGEKGLPTGEKCRKEARRYKEFFFLKGEAGKATMA